MRTEDRRTCSNCGNGFSGAIEFCPVCALRKALADGVESGEPSSEDTVTFAPEQATQRFEHYELLTAEDGQPLELGRGAMGVTYKAFDVDLQCPVTLKVISERYLGDESARLRFLREARAAARLRHTNVASVLHLGRTGQNYFYAMEFVEGETLENLIKRSERLQLKLTLEIAAQVMPYYLVLKAEALYLAGRTREALETIEEVEALGDRYEERNWRAEPHSLRGVFLAALGAEEAQIDASFCEGIRIARQQKSIFLEERAEGAYAEYRRQKMNASGKRGFRLPLW